MRSRNATLSGLFALMLGCGMLAAHAQVQNPGERPTGEFSNQRAGESRSGTNPLVPEQPQKRTNDIMKSATGSLQLSADQRQSIRNYFSSRKQESVNSISFAISVGASIPHQAKLKPLPPELAAVLPKFRGDEYLLVRDQLVIVEPQVRRIVAVIPGAT